MTQAVPIDWQQETRVYDRPHPRLVTMARILAALPERTLLDVGCSTAALRRCLPRGFDYYGCDVTDHALGVLGPERFRQLDFNQSCDLSFFASRGIDVACIGGVLEYLERPRELLEALRGLLPTGGALVLSLINFEALKYADRKAHHPGWIFHPTLDAGRALLAGTGWQIVREEPFVALSGIRGQLVTPWAAWCGVDHPWTRRHSRQFILSARAA